MYQIIIIFHVLLGLGIIGLILIQQGKGADAGASFGAGASGSVFGAQGAGSFLTRTTATLATLFFMTSLGLAILNGKQGAAYDLMSQDAAQKGAAGIPQAEPKPADPIPTAPEIVAPAPIQQAIDPSLAAPAAQPAPESSQPEAISDTVVPKPEEVKPVEIAKPVEAPKPAEEVKPAVEPKKAAPTAKKDSSKPAAAKDKKKAETTDKKAKEKEHK